MLFELFIQNVLVKFLVFLKGHHFFASLLLGSFVDLLTDLAIGFVDFGDLRFGLQDGVRFFPRRIESRAQTEWVGRQCVVDRRLPLLAMDRLRRVRHDDWPPVVLCGFDLGVAEAGDASGPDRQTGVAWRVFTRRVLRYELVVGRAFDRQCLNPVLHVSIVLCLQVRSQCSVLFVIGCMVFPVCRLRLSFNHQLHGIMVFEF